MAKELRDGIVDQVDLMLLDLLFHLLEFESLFIINLRDQTREE
jgi:hypothetical protein